MRLLVFELEALAVHTDGRTDGRTDGQTNGLDPYYGLL